MPELGAVYEITEAQWFDALGVMFPEKWEANVREVDIFRWTEHYDSDSTYHFCTIRNSSKRNDLRYFKTLRRLDANYDSICADIKFYAEAFPITEKHCKDIECNV